MKKITLACVLAILCLHLTSLFAQNNTTVTGTVRNTAGQPLAGATVTNTRTGRGTLTNAAGVFTLHGAQAGDKLRISYIGYAAQTLSPGKGASLTITLKEATNELDRVVVQAYGTTSDRLRTGNISKVTAAEIAKQPVMNVLNVLQGLVPGADVNNTTGYASGVVKVELRGRNLINTGFSSDPLYVIDGVPLTIQDLYNQDSYSGGSVGVNQAGLKGPGNGQSPFFNINPGDIESIEVLKDADATAIYGSRAANGVILITTKHGKTGKTAIEVNATMGFTNVVKTYQLLNTQQYVAMRREALQNDGLPINVQTAPDLVVWDTTRYTNWQKELMTGGRSAALNAVLSGGNLYTIFRLSANYQDQKDLSTYSGSNRRGTFAANLNHQSQNRKLRVNLSSFYSMAGTNLKQMPFIMNLPPNAPAIWDANGNLNYNGWVPLDNKFAFGGLLQTYASKTGMLNTSLLTQYELTGGLLFKTSFGYSNIQSEQTSVNPIAAANPRDNVTGQNRFGNTFISNWIIEPQLEYNATLSKGRLTLLAGGSFQNNTTGSVVVQGRGYTNDALLNSVSNAPIQSAGNAKEFYKYAAVFGRITYNWQDKYITNINWRRDGSSKFGPGRQFGNFGSAGAAWIFSEEQWVKNNLQFLSFGKLRGSYGTTGGDQIGNYQYLSRWAFGYSNTAYNGVLVLNPASHLDSLIHWQTNHKTELGLALGFLKDRLMIDFSWYRNRCDNQLVSFPTPAFTGFTTVLTNSPANVENKGQELTVTGQVMKGKRLQWTVKVNISKNRNRLLSYPNFSTSPYFGVYQLGQSLLISKILKSRGVDPAIGDYYFEDLNGNGKIDIDYSGKTIDDRYVIDRTPRYLGGITNTFSYRNWQLSFLFYFKKQTGRSVLNDADYPGSMYNQPASVLARWQAPGDVTAVPRYSTQPSGTTYNRYFRNSDAMWVDASFIRLQNLNISYSLNERQSKKAGLSGGSIFVKAQNLFVYSSYNGLDPEIQSFGSPPLPRILTAGISIKL